MNDDEQNKRAMEFPRLSEAQALAVIGGLLTAITQMHGKLAQVLGPAREDEIQALKEHMIQTAKNAPLAGFPTADEKAAVDVTIGVIELGMRKIIWSYPDDLGRADDDPAAGG